MLMIKESDDFIQSLLQIRKICSLQSSFLKKQRLHVPLHVLTERMVEYCYFHEEQTRELDAWLVSLNPGELTKKTRVYLIELCILRVQQGSI